MIEDEFGNPVQESDVDYFCRMKASLSEDEIDERINAWAKESLEIGALFSIWAGELSPDEVLRIGRLAIEAGVPIFPVGLWANDSLNSFRHALESFEAHEKQRLKIDPGPLLREAFERGWEGPRTASNLLGASVNADQLPPEYEPPDELVQGLLTKRAVSMLYGDSNSGKTFFSVDLACAVARGVPWLGRNTEPGLVIYVAAESPQSIRSRVQAYQLHHGCKVPNLVILELPIDLHASDDDANAIIEAVTVYALKHGLPVRLIIFDTLARISAGANENSGSDMGMVVKRLDRIREATGAHLLLIHHSGKNQASGARGWSGIRAAIDTEIEVSESAQGRVAEITKQRDLPTKGQRIGFALKPVAIGRTKWGEPASSCIVVPADTPASAPRGKRTGPVEAAVVDFIRTHPNGVKKIEVKQHFDGRFEKSSVYRAIASRVKAGVLIEADDVVRLKAA